MVLRPEVRAFAEYLEYKLQVNEHKPSKGLDDADYLRFRLAEEARELHDAVVSGAPIEQVLSEAADVANFALFTAMFAVKQNGYKVNILAELVKVLEAKQLEATEE